MFSGTKLSLARQRAGLSKKRFAELLDVHPRTIIRWESGDRIPDPKELGKLVNLLGFPESYFLSSEVDIVSATSASFRSLTAMSASERDAALAAGSFGFMLMDWVEQSYGLPDPDLDDLRFETPEVAARSLREKWLIGERPISNMIRLLESKGVRVLSLSENVKTVDAFSVWRNRTPYVFLNCFKSPEHQRFDAAHELGHLVLHKHGSPNGRTAEHEANRFASAFLMPEADVRAALPIVYSLNQMIKAKSRWKVSLSALNYRAHKLGLISDWEYRTFCIDIQRLGYRTHEPEGIERERSSLWEQVFEDLRSRGVTKAQIAEAIHLPVREFENLVFGLLKLLSIDGDGEGDGRGRAQLKLVSSRVTAQ